MNIWECKNFFIILLAVGLLSSGFIGMSQFVFADNDNKQEKWRETTLEDLGILQIAAHDFFNTDRCNNKNDKCAVQFENGKLDLSTLLFDPTTGEPRSDDDIMLGGELRNRVSILIFTVSSELGEKYLELRAQFGEDLAYEKILDIYHHKVKQSFQRTFDQPFPKPQLGEVDANHNLALRSGHDFLPGNVIFNGELVNVFTLTGEKFNQSERKQKSSPLDGQFDEEFLGIDICITPVFCINVDLLEADRSFGDQFDTTFSFDHFMEETSDGRYDKHEDVTGLLIELFARGINLT